MARSNYWSRRFRRSASRWWLTFLGGVFVLICLASATAPDPSSGQPAEDTIALPARIVYGVAGVVLTVMLVRWFRSGIFTSRRGVTFRNVLATSFLAWEEVDHFERPARYGIWRKAGLRAVKRDGTLVASSTYQAGPGNRVSFADDVVAELEELRLRAGEAPPGSPDPLPGVGR